MTSTLSPYDTGDIRLGDHTRDLTYLTRPPVMRRPEATGELPIYRPVGVDELARLSAGPTLVLPVGAVPVVDLPRPLGRMKPWGGYGHHRRYPGMARSPWWVNQLVGALVALSVQAAAVSILLAVVR